MMQPDYHIKYNAIHRDTLIELLSSKTSRDEVIQETYPRERKIEQQIN